MLSLYNRIFKVENPACRLMQHLLSRFIFYGVAVPETLLDRVVSMGKSSTTRAFNSQYISQTTVPNNDGLVDSVRHLLFTDSFTKPNSYVHILVHLLTTALTKYITCFFYVCMYCWFLFYQAIYFSSPCVFYI